MCPEKKAIFSFDANRFTTINSRRHGRSEPGASFPVPLGTTNRPTSCGAGDRVEPTFGQAVRHRLDDAIPGDAAAAQTAGARAQADGQRRAKRAPQGEEPPSPAGLPAGAAVSTLASLLAVASDEPTLATTTAAALAASAAATGAAAAATALAAAAGAAGDRALRRKTRRALASCSRRIARVAGAARETRASSLPPSSSLYTSLTSTLHPLLPPTPTSLHPHLLPDGQWPGRGKTVGEGR